MNVNPIERLMNPASIAIAGASNNFTTMGTIQCMNLITNGFPGKIFPVHPTEKTVLGLSAYASVADLPHAPDLAVLVVPTRLVLDMLDAFGRIGTKHMIIVTAGFGETGQKGRATETELLERARHYGIRFLGPNCLGIVNTHLPLNITVGPLQDYNGRLGIASQSGTYIAQVVSLLHRNGIVLSKAISVGNEADIDIVDCIEYLGQDEATKAIGLYIEGIRDAARFLAVARQVSRTKPIVAQYVGGTEAGARSGASHTGAMAGPLHLYQGLFEQAGIISVDSMDDVYKIGWALATQPVPRGRRMAVLTNSGGPGSGIANACNRAGLEVPEFSPALREKIGAFIAGHASARNPVDLTFHIDMKALAEEIPRLLFASAEVDGVIIHGLMDTAFMSLIYPGVSRFVEISKEDLIGRTRMDVSALASMPGDFGKPLMISSFFGKEDHCIDTLQTSGVPAFDVPEKTAQAMWALFQQSLIRQRPFDPERPIGEAPDEAIRLMATTCEAGFDEYQAKHLLRIYGIPTTRESLAVNLEEAKTAARRIGYPVALKVCSPAIAHKTERGLVRLHLRNEDELAEAYRTIRQREPEAPLLVAEMLQGDRELMAGVTSHPGFPPCVVFGLGGILTEALHDVSLRLAPLVAQEAEDMMEGLRSRKLLGPYRGMNPVDRQPLKEILMALGRLALHFPQIREIDLNPIIVVDGRPVVADALIVL